MNRNKKKSKEHRIAIINHDKCKPKKCNQECKKKCPPNLMGKKCVEVTKTSKAAKISEELCIGCGMCVKVCPFGAIQIVKLPSELEENLVYTYGENCFRLYKLPIPKIGQIVGFIGQNGIGKSTLMRVLSNEIVPNFGDFEKEDDIQQVLKATRGTELQKYLKKLYDKKLKIKIKPQNVDKILRSIQKTKKELRVSELIGKHYEESDEWHNRVIDHLDLRRLFDNKVANISGGELQRLICCLIMLQKADVYVFDEPTNYLDIRQRLNVANLIRELSNHGNYIFIVEHDLSILDYTSDLICIMYGKPGAYGVVSTPHSTASAINMFFDGYIPSDNVRFRPESYSFKEKLELSFDPVETSQLVQYNYDDGVVEFDKFKLNIQGGKFYDSSMILLLGKNGSGKTTFLNYLAKKMELVISYKKQYADITKFSKNGRYPNVLQFLSSKIRKYFGSAQFNSDVMEPLDIKRLYEKKLNKLSGGELQRVMITYALGQDANVYLIDEPSASLDIEQRVAVTKVIKRFLLHNKKTGFIVEHDMMMAMSMSMETNSRIVVFDRDFNTELNKMESFSSKPLHFSEGINKFLAQLDITFRTEGYSRVKRPRINKRGSSKDSQQKKEGKYYN